MTKLDPLDHLHPVSGAHWAHGGLGGVKVRPCSPSDRAADRKKRKAPSYTFIYAAFNFVFRKSRLSAPLQALAVAVAVAVQKTAEPPPVALVPG